MPELPEVESLVQFLRDRAVGRVVTGVEVGAINALKTYDPPPSALAGMSVDAVHRHGKFIDLDVGGLHLIFHLARAGWLRWSEKSPTATVRPGKNPIALRVRLFDPDADSTPGFDLTEAGTQKRLAVYVVREAAQVPGIASLGSDPLGAGFTAQTLAGILAGSHQQVKGLLRDQSVIAGVGNAYSDEVLHAARLSPYAVAGRLDEAQVARLAAAMHDVLTAAITASRGKPAAELKDSKRAGMAVHGRAGQACPVCGDVVREVSFADRALQYCATCQTGGKVLADRRLSRLLK
jgi:formamidopyrimidine-DNA glycosylase